MNFGGTNIHDVRKGNACPWSEKVVLSVSKISEYVVKGHFSAPEPGNIRDKVFVQLRLAVLKFSLFAHLNESTFRQVPRKQCRHPVKFRY